LLASAITLVCILVRPPVRKKESLRCLGRISLFGILGTMAGIIGLIVTYFTLGR
jgi:hypothetical protein